MVLIRSVVIVAALSFLMYWITATSMLFIIPLLFFAPKFKSKHFALLPVGVVALLLLLYQLYGYGDSLRDNSILGALLVGLFIPFVLLVAVTLWILLSHKRLFIRYVVSCSGVALLGFGVVAWFSGGSSTVQSIEQLYRSLIVSMAPTLFKGTLPFGFSGDEVFDLLILVLRVAFLPIFMWQFGLSAFISELLINRTQWSYQERMCRWALPEGAIWFFLGSWSGVLATLLIPYPLFQSVAWNLAFALTLLYTIQGMAIVASFVRRKNSQISATKVFILCSLLALLPAVNVVPIVALPLLGVSENWIKFRKNV